MRCCTHFLPLTQALRPQGYIHWKVTAGSAPDVASPGSVDHHSTAWVCLVYLLHVNLTGWEQNGKWQELLSRHPAGELEGFNLEQ